MSKRKNSHSELQESGNLSSGLRDEKRKKIEQYEQDDGCLCFHTPDMKDQAQQNGLASNADSDPASSFPVVEINANVPTYCYKPLDHNQIRILVLLPGEFGTPLKAELHTCHLCEECGQIDASGAPNEVDNDGYEALSYAWGPPVFDHTIEVGVSTFLGITRSLYDALQHLRYLEQSRRIWADAVCINQRDDDEKSRQVTRMMEIYRQAHNVVVWLGPSAPDDELAFSTIEAVQDIYRVSTAFAEMASDLIDPPRQQRASLPRSIQGIFNSHLEEGTPDYMVRLQRLWLEWKSIFDHTGRIKMKDESLRSGIQSIHAVLSATSQCQKDVFAFYADQITESAPGLFAASALFTRPWWSRLWVIQEVASREDHEQVTIVSGFFSVSFSKFGSAMWLLQDLVNEKALKWRAQNDCTFRQFNEGFDVLKDVFGEVHDSSYDTGLSKIVQLGSWKCSIPHDRIYAMYGLLNLKAYSMLAVDYSREPGELFHAFSLAVLTEGDAISGEGSPSVTMTGGGCRGTSTKVHSLLAMVGTESQPSSLDSLPSWVPNFDRLSASSMIKFAVHNAASSGEWEDVSQWKPEHPFHGQPTFDYPFQNIMRLQGRVFARVEEVLYGSEWPKFVLATSTAELHALRIFGWYTRCMAFVKRALAVAISPYRILQAVVPLAVSDDDGHYDHLATLYKKFLDDQAKKEDIYWRGVDIDFMTTIHLATLALSVGGDFNKFIDPNRNLCSLVTSAGDKDIGWVPMSARKGDEFCVLRSCRYPFLIRPAECGRHRLVGDAWTLKTSLKEALGGLHDCPDPVECREQDDVKVSCNSWDSKDPEIVDLIANLGEIVLE